MLPSRCPDSPAAKPATANDSPSITANAHAKPDLANQTITR